MATDQNTHKSGPLKQQNKSHKHGRHRTKGQVDKSHKGKVDVKSLSKKNKNLDKQQRRHQAKQVRKNKREEVLEKKRKLGTEHSPPHLIVIFPLSSNCNCEEALEYLVESDDTIIPIRNENTTTIISPRHRQRFQVIIPQRNFFSVLNAAKVADSFLFLHPANNEIDEIGQKCLTCILAQGLPTNIHAVQGLRNVKKQGDVKKNIQKSLEKWMPSVKLHSLDSKQDGELVLRLLSNQKQKRIFYRENRPYIVADKVQFESNQDDESKGTLKISGFIRGQSLSVNRLVHLPQLGDFQLKKIDLPRDPYSMKRKDSNSNNMEGDEDNSMEEDVKTIAVADPSKQETLVTEAEVDPMDAEQTWPTEEEIKQAQDEAKAQMETERKIKRVPKGTSEYQAAWIDEDDDDSGESEYEDSEDSEEEDMQYAQMQQSDDEQEVAQDKEEFDTISVAATTVINDEKYDAQFDEDEEQRQLEKYRDEHENEMFPDEIDTPQDIDARVRFQKYRGLKSFRTSPWDPKENLPLDYARIFQFQNFNRTKKRIMKQLQDDEDCALGGWYVTIHVKDVPKVYYENRDTSDPLVVFGLIPYEQKMTVMNFVLKRHPSCGVPIKSKERLIFHVGYRMFSACPIFSQHTNSDKFKGERFLPHDAVTMATVYAPIFFPPAPVLVFTENCELLATGTVAGSNPDRVVVKKIVLSGHPFKINKKSSVVRYMFFSREDILWFKPVEVWTKYGRRGNIKEALGTHGHMKCVFDGQLKAQDTVCMNLFKRLFPKWTYDPNIDIRNFKMITSSSVMTSHEDNEGDVEM
ncbi:pre-rRNA-processing protein TSR1 homolog [Clytia hemisphaerica]|uniref:Pre-rRNA-processing protein TSR1 homolog n=1 Tax=Clytia hemisphaerica TaxID=252671 RepID=A0A7M5VAP6_9CNID